MSLLNQASARADRLIVGLNSDKSGAPPEGTRPADPERREPRHGPELAARGGCGGHLRGGHAAELIAALEPDVLVKGADYTVATVVGADLVLAARRQGAAGRPGARAQHDRDDRAHRGGQRRRETRARPGRVAVILDRDGTIVVDRGYLADPERLSFLPGRRRRAASCCTAAATRSSSSATSPASGVACSHSSGCTRATQRLPHMLQDSRAPARRHLFLPAPARGGCDCRKPNTAAAAARPRRELGFEPADAVVIGDKSSDIELGRRVGAATIAGDLQRPDAERCRAGAPTTPCRDLIEAARIIGPARATPPRRAAAAGRAPERCMS